MDHWLIEGLLWPNIVAEESEDGGSEESLTEEVDFEARVSELEEELQYAKAETLNIAQRAARDRSETLKYGAASLARRLIPAIDHLSKALEATEVGEETESVIAGVRLTLDGLRSSLESEGIYEIKSLGIDFDPTCMEAIATVACPEGKNPGSVIEVIETGYRMHDRILRASKVVVAEGDS
tara:strand:+ start:1431 stop:1973 length:543 start_codon:yes stop_codon:yes gene_type:complete